MPESGLSGIFERMTRIESDADKAETELRAKLEFLERDVAVKLDVLKEGLHKEGKRVDEVKTEQALSNQRMTAIEKSLEKIDDNTTHTRRQMTGIIVGAVATGVIGGAIALIYGLIGGGIV